MRSEIGCKALLLNLMLPVMPYRLSFSDRVRMRRLDIAALATLLLCDICILWLIRMKRKREEKSLSWVTWKDGPPVRSDDHTAANRALLQWGVLAAAGLLGASYSWITNHWIILPVFLAGGYWAGWRAQKLLRH